MFLLRNTLFLLLALSILGGCQPKVYLMPPPVALNTESELFNLEPVGKDDNLLYTLYATNRIPYKSTTNSSGYTIFPSKTIRFGYVVFSVGDDNMSWEDLHRQSLADKRDADLLLTLKFTREVTLYDKKDPVDKTSSSGEGFFDKVNMFLNETPDKDLTVYVHGANSNFYRSTAQGAQYFHYTGHNSLILTYSWPSAESLLRYKTDVLNASQSVTTFVRLLEILATHTRARNINILTYSAGARLVAPALASLTRRFPDKTNAEIKEKFRIGEVYFAAPDTPFQPFIEQYLQFENLVNRTTINLNGNDSVLRLASFHDGISRLGKPDLTELNEQEMNLMIKATQQPSLNVIDLKKSKGLNIGSSHNSWYNHPWVSNDLLLLFLFNAPPKQRGLLVHNYESGAITYYFPDNYDQLIKQIIANNRGRRPNQISLKGNN